jgi:hypothetical protein
MTRAEQTEYMRQYREENREQYNANARLRYHKNLEKYRAYHRAYYHRRKANNNEQREAD